MTALAWFVIGYMAALLMLVALLMVGGGKPKSPRG